MAAVAGIFLWSLVSIALPILIALWNRKRFRREKFGGFYLLKKVSEVTRRRIQILQILKLLNRIAMFTLIVLIFAEPLKKEMSYSEAGEGFAIILDVGRVMQSSTASGIPLIDLQEKAALEALQNMPDSSQGIILQVSDSCDALKLSGGRLTATAPDFRKAWSRNSVGYSNSPTSSTGLSQCLARIRSLYGEKEILKIFISPLPSTINEQQLRLAQLKIEKLEAPAAVSHQTSDVSQEPSAEKVEFFFDSNEQKDLFLVYANSTVEPLGRVEGQLDLLPNDQSWIWAKGETSVDPWIKQELFEVQSLKSSEVVLWSKKETNGFKSLLSALRSHPSIKVVRQLGGTPVGDNVIVYGDYSLGFENLGRAWFFISPNSESAFNIRDQKQWRPSSGGDLRRSFLIQTGIGEIFVKRYALLDVTSLEVLEAFEDGAPSVYQNLLSDSKQLISPFDLEDLTTDLTLEPTFIPYLYSWLDRWLADEDSADDMSRAKAIWLMPGRTTPSDSVVAKNDWPGIYQRGGSYTTVLPSEMPESFLTGGEQLVKASMIEEEISLRSEFLKWLIFCVALELILCFVSARFGILMGLLLAIGGIQTLEASTAVQKIPLAVLPEIDSDRKTALNQFVGLVDRMSNLDFAPAESARYEDLWKYAVVVMSSSKEWKIPSNSAVEAVRDYLERGGLLIFDDPLAKRDSLFYRSVKRELARVFPGRGLEVVPRDSVLFRTFYLLREVSGRRLSSPTIEGIKLDRRWVAIFSFNDLLGANLRSSGGDYAYSVSPYGQAQRTLSQRLLLNLLMYSVAVDYKDDAIHLPHILRRRVR